MEETPRQDEQEIKNHQQVNQDETGSEESQVSTDKSADDEVLSVSKSDYEALQADLEKSRAEASDHYERYVRLAAELENFRRRTEKEKSDLQKFGTESFLKSLLPVLDSFDRALSELEGDQAKEKNPLEEGVLMVKKQLTETLEKQGLAAIEAVGAVFDPNLHQAIRKVEDPEAKEERVQEEYSKGYLLNDRLIRPAMVSVIVPG